MRKYIVTLSVEEREQLEALSSRGSHKSHKVLNALILLNCDDGEHQDGRSTNEQVSRVLKVGMRTIDRVKRRFVEDGLDAALNGRKSRRVYERKTDGDFEAHLIALSCGQPPEGHARWSLRLLADKAVELHYITEVSHETVRRVLKKTNSSPGGRSNG